MAWTVLYHDAFVPELEALPVAVQDGVLTMVFGAWPSRSTPNAAP
jgi:hypothetical protein